MLRICTICTGILAFVFPFCDVPAQSGSRSATVPEVSLLEKLQVPQQSGSLVPLGAVVSPEEYIVGPSDGLALNVWMSPPLRFQLDVTPEGTLIIPTIGEARVAGLTLAATKDLVVSLVTRRYLQARVTLTLIRPRPILVTVQGVVLREGQYTLTATDRADRAVQMANTPLMEEDAGLLKQIEETMSRRHVMIRHLDGSTSRADIVKYLGTGRDRDNPYLREGDVVVVPERKRYSDMYAVYGEVNAPGRIEYVPGDMLSDAIRMSQGFTPHAITDSVTISTLSEDGRMMEERTAVFIGDSVSSGTDELIRPGDRIIVRKHIDLRSDYRVHVGGEILYPGTYPITKDRTRLSEVIAQAGGFTKYASLKSAELSRRSIQPEEVETDRMMSFRGGISTEDSLDYLLETELRLKKEIVKVDFEKLFAGEDSTQDIYLQNEDIIVIPAVSGTIYVFGQIVTPGHIQFRAGADPNYYIGQAGGFTERARRDDLKIIKSRTKQWLAADETDVEQGDYIWVPKDPDRPFAYYMTVASQAAGVLSVIIGMTAVIISVSK